MTLIEYRCPLCKSALEKNNRSLQCENKHCFDFAKEGYINLLPVQNKKSKSPGDSAEMIQARRRFLERDYYANFAKFLSAKISAPHLPKSILDIGCGEGYYLAKLIGGLGDAEIHGVDISKPAVKMCAKKIPSGTFSVASAFDLPYFEAQFDYILSIFAPIDFSEVARALQAGGKFFFVGPGPNHLRSLAAEVYTSAHSHKGNNEHNLPENLILVDESRYQEKIEVSGEHLLDLLLMTPYYWSCSTENKQKLEELASLTVELDFELKTYTKSL